MPAMVRVKLSGGYILFGEINLQGSAGIGGSGSFGFAWDTQSDMYGISIGGALAEFLGVRGSLKVWIDY